MALYSNLELDTNGRRRNATISEIRKELKGMKTQENRVLGRASVKKTVLSRKRKRKERVAKWFLLVRVARRIL